MSGPKSSKAEIEQQKRQRLEEALRARKAAYVQAMGVRQCLLKDVNRNMIFLKGKQDALKLEKTGNPQIAAAHQRHVSTVEKLLRALKDIENDDIPPLDVITESESAYCAQAEYLNQRSEMLRTQFVKLLSEYSVEERQIKENIAANAALESQRAVCDKRIRQFAQELEEIIRNQQSVQEMENAVSGIRNALDTLLDDADKLLHLPVPPQTDEVQRLIARTVSEADALLNAANQAVSKPLEQMGKFAVSQKELSDTLDRFAEQQKVAASFKTLEAIDDILYIEFEAPDYYKTLEEEARKELDSILDKIEDTICDDSVCAEDAYSIAMVYCRILKTTEHSQGSLAAELVQARDILAQVRARAEIFERCYCKYVASCELLNQLYRENGAGAKKIEILERDEFVSYDALRDEEERIDGILTLENEKSFIRRSINEVMQKFGYNIAEDFVLSRAQKGTHLLCKKADERTAIHLHCSDGPKKRIMLEVVGVGNASGQILKEGANGTIIGPDVLSAARKQELLEEQTAFCKIHPEIVKELAARGVLMHAVELNPPGLEFCEEIAIVDKDSEINDKSAASTTKSGIEGAKGNRRRRPVPKYMEMRMSKRKIR